MKVLVILASYNGEKYIKKQIESIINQKNVELDLKIFDDCSTDSTCKVIAPFCFQNNVQLIENFAPTGSAANNFFNAIKSLSQEIINSYGLIAFADQDDIWLDNKLEAAVNILMAEKSSLYCSNLILWNEKKDTKKLINKSYPQKKYDFLFEGGSAGCTYVFTNTLCFELKILLERIDYANWKFFSHDWFVYFFARINDYKVSIDSNAYILYRIHDNNVHGQLNSISLYAIKERLKMIKEGWFFHQINGFSKLMPENSQYKSIYNLYSKNYFTRFYVLLKYNFQLIRSRNKMIQFGILSLIPIKVKNNV